MLTHASSATTRLGNEEDDAAIIISPSRLDLVPDVEVLVPDVDEQIAQIVNNFWHQTNVLAGQNARLHLQQHVQAQSQASSLMAVHANAEQNVGRLAELQHQNATQLAAIMEEAKNSMQQQPQALAQQQARSDHELHRSLEERIQKVFAEAVAARELALQQSQEAQRLEATMKEAITSLQADLTGRIDDARPSDTDQKLDAIAKRLEEKWKELETELEANINRFAKEAVNQHSSQQREKGPAYTRIKHIVEKSTTEVEARMKLALQQHLDAVNADLNSRAETERKRNDRQIMVASTDAEDRIHA
jgi:hypothetical protein